MAIENINDYAGMWANGVNIGQLWDKIKEKFVSGAHVQSDATTYPASWKQQARANIGLTIGANKMWYGSAANTIGEVTTSTFGRGLLNTSSGTEITGLFAETAEKDKNGIEISENYAHSLAISDGYLRLKNNRYVSGTASAQDLSALQLNVKLGLLQLDNTGSAGKIPLVHIPDSILGQLTYGGTITAYVSANNTLTISITTGAKAILEQNTGRSIGNKTVRLSAFAHSSSSFPVDDASYIYFNYEDCTGIYFIWTDAALASHTDEPDYRVWPSGGPRYQSGDWLISNDTKWDKVDNTDAVTGVKGSNESAFRLGNVSIDALDVRALATYLTNTTQTVADKVQFNQDIWSLGGVAAYGISDLSAGGGGGGGLSGTIIRNWSNYQGAETEVLGANLGMRGFRMSGYSFQVNKPAVGADNWQTEFTLSTENIPDLPLTQITGTGDLQAIEALTDTSGFLKKTAANTWSLATDVVTLAGQQALTNKTYNGYTLAAACAKGVDTELTANSSSVNLPTSAAVASFVSQYGNSLFTLLGNDNDQLSATIGTTNKKLTLDYAKKTSRMRTEIKADQEFVYRQSPQTIDADSLVINKFKGRTLVWNQMVKNGNFIGISNWRVTANATCSVNNGICTITSTASGNGLRQDMSISTVQGHKYLMRVDAKGQNGGEGLRFTIQTSSIVTEHTLTNQFKSYSIIGTANSSRNVLEISVDNATMYVANVVVVDLTLMFGAGNEPSTVEEFEALFPNAYYEYNAGELRNNDAKQFETVGFNLWDEEWEVGELDANGANLANSSKIRSKNYCPIVGGSSCYMNNLAYVCFYDANKTFIGSVQPDNSTFSVPSNACYFRFNMAQTYGATYLNNICVNISDTSKNGTYEPYRRIVTDLNLDAIQVKSHNIWDEEWEVGSISFSNGQNEVSTGQIRTKGYIPVMPNGSYYAKVPNGAIWATAYDANKNYIGGLNTNYSFANVVVSVPSNAHYIRFWTNQTYGSTYNNDICINESSSFNGQYEPHGILTINGLKQAGSVYDEIVGKKFIQRVWSYTFNGEEGWNKNGSAPQYTSNVGLLVGRKLSASYWGSVGNLVHSRLTPASKGSIYDGSSTNAIGFGDSTSNPNVVISEDAYNNRNNVITGTTIYYELATPIEYELASPIPDTMPAGTTERIISDRLPITPFACDMTYGANPKDILASAVPFSRLQGVRLERGAFTMSTQNDSNWYLVTLGDKKLYLRFTVNTGAFKLEMASDDTENPEYSKSFEFATLSTSEIDAICV